MINPTWIVTAFSSVILLGGCATDHRAHSTVSQMVDDARMTTQIRERYAESPVVRALAIKVDTDNGLVTLTGAAKNAEEKHTAETIARAVPQVRSVKNNIVIQP